MKKRPCRTMAFALAFALAALSLAGCRAAESTTPGAPKTLRVLGDAFTVDVYNIAFAVSQDNVEVELIDPSNEFKKIIEEQIKKRQENGDPDSIRGVDYLEVYRNLLTGPEAPDVVFIDERSYRTLAKEGLLLALDGFIDKDRFPLDRLAPGLVDALRELGEGTLYGFAPTFSAYALVYNKDRFDAAGLPYPTDEMTWDELFDLAEALAGEKDGKKRYGLSYGGAFDPIRLTETMLAQQEVMLFTDDGKPNPVDTPERRAVWTRLVELEKRGVIAPPLSDRLEEIKRASSEAQGGDRFVTPYEDDDFLSERAAMQLISSGQLLYIRNVLNDAFFFGDNWTPPSFDWDLAAFPAPADHPDAGGPVHMSRIVAINANAAEPDLAWRYIRLVMSDKLARASRNSNSFFGELKAYVDANATEALQGVNLEAFWKRKPIIVPLYTTNETEARVLDALNGAMQRVRKEGASVDEALQAAEREIRQERKE
ncbi:MAG: extracellular solute-binding protein [Hydrogenibacillus schlegelii]|uniref:Extracellular solute-binding protein n=1 Tax=Hydrogenibacillus schlegelii TaxID=1484 RepID=A0A947CUP5_HYDSH|nr:extracellular solute-binding protein [Hydrogenibacillus schlegelii]